MSTREEKELYTKHILKTIKLSDYVSEEAIPLVYDVMRILTIQIIYHMMYYLSDPETVGSNIGSVIESILYLCLGATVYWLIIRKLVTLV
jgi:hypothetical protein